MKYLPSYGWPTRNPYCGTRPLLTRLPLLLLGYWQTSFGSVDLWKRTCPKPRASDWFAPEVARFPDIFEHLNSISFFFKVIIFWGSYLIFYRNVICRNGRGKFLFYDPIFVVTWWTLYTSQYGLYGCNISRCHNNVIYKFGLLNKPKAVSWTVISQTIPNLYYGN